MKSTLRVLKKSAKYALRLPLYLLAMAIAGSSRPCSGAEHLISHALDRLLPRPSPHGLQVGIATLFVQLLRGAQVDEIKEVFRITTFPQTLRELGIEKRMFVKAVEVAPQMRPARLTILSTPPTTGQLLKALEAIE